MLSLYHIFFKIALLLPLGGVLNSAFLNKNFRLQKIINNFTYITESIILFVILFFYKNHDTYNLQLMDISIKMPIVFSVNFFNIVFAFTLSFLMLFFNFVFQNYFYFLNLPEKYKLYNLPFSYLYFLFILFSFSNNILISLFLYICVFVFSLFLLTNPVLKEFRQRYSIIFSVSIINYAILLIFSAFTFFYNDNTLFIKRAANNLYNMPIYWLIGTIAFLIFTQLIFPVYVIFKENIYYEDLLPLFVITFFPAVYLNTYFFIKIFYYTFINYGNIQLYFYYTGFFVILLFLISSFFAIKYIKHNIKFSLLYFILNYTLMLSHLLFASTERDLINFFINFIFFAYSVVLFILTLAAILFTMLKAKITDIAILKKFFKKQVRFYAITLFTPLFVNIVSFLNLNFNNFNILYFINLIQILLTVILFIVYIVIVVNKKVDKEVKLKAELSLKDQNVFFRVQFFLFAVLILLIFAKKYFINFLF